MFTNDPSKRGWDGPASADAQARFNAAAAKLEQLISERRADVNAAMQQYTAKGVADEYHAKERNWTAAADNVQEIALKLVASLVTTDGHGGQALNQAGQAVASII
jgi:hypothetical protein